MHSMEMEDGICLKVDTGMRVKSYFRFRTNEIGARARVALSGFIAEYLP
jgi:hypothetical protein